AGLPLLLLLGIGALHWLHAQEPHFVPTPLLIGIDALALFLIMGLLILIGSTPSSKKRHHVTSSTPSVVEIAQKLIQCKSVTPEDAGALPYIAHLLETAGFSVHLVPFSDPHHPTTVQNLYARIGHGAPALLFAGHTDVVPPGPIES